MDLNSGFLFQLLSLFVIILYILAIFVCLKRLKVTGSAAVQRIFTSVILLVLWLFLLSSSAGIFSAALIPVAFIILIIGAALFSFSNLGTLLAKGLRYEELIGFNSIRVLSEAALIVAAKEGLAPELITMGGWNFDLLTGLSALVLAVYIPRFPNYRLIRWWNWIGLFFWIIFSALAMFSQPATWIIQWPQVLLPGLIAWSCLCSHFLLFKKLSLDPKKIIH